MKRFLACCLMVSSLALAAGAALSPTPAQARVSVGIGIGVPLFAPAYPAPVYYPPYYYAPPVYYAPPPAPPLAPPVPAPTAAASQQCREYSTTTMIGGAPQQMVGTACLQPDGSWRIQD